MLCSSRICFMILFVQITAVNTKVRPMEKVTVALRERKPFLVLDESETPTGLDVQVIENFARKFNLHVDYYIMDSLGFNLNGEYSNNLSTQTNLSKTDIIVGALDENALTSEYFIASRSYYHDKVTWCVQKKRAIPIWKNIFRICTDSYVWILYVLMSFSSISCGYFLQQFEDLHPKWTWFRITICAFCSVCGFSNDYKPQSISNRIFFTFCLFGNMIFAVSTVVFFIKATSTTMFYENQIESVHEIKPFDLKGDKFALQHLMKQNETYPLEMLIDYEICNNLDHCIEELKTNSELAVAVSLEYSRSNRFKTNSQIFCFEHSSVIYDYALYFMVRKDFSHLKKLNRFIGFASDSGLIEKWRLIGQTSTCATHNEGNYSNIKTNQLLGTIIIFGIIEIFVISTIVLERFVHKKVNGRNPSKVWILADMLINPDRLFLKDTKWTN